MIRETIKRWIKTPPKTSQEKLAEMSGMQQGQLSRYLAGKKEINSGSLEKILTSLKLKICPQPDAVEITKWQKSAATKEGREFNEIDHYAVGQIMKYLEEH